MKIYVASYAGNGRQEEVINFLREEGHKVAAHYDPKKVSKRFRWCDVDKDWVNWTSHDFCEALKTETAISAFYPVWNAMWWADACVLVQPCRRDAYMEAGFFIGAYKPMFILLADGEPELMFKMATAVCSDLAALKVLLGNCEIRPF